MDSVDKKIIALLKQNARMTASEIAGKVHLSVPAAAERLKKLDRTGIIDQYTIKLNRKKLGLNLMAYIEVTIDQKAYQEELRETLHNFKAAMNQSDNVLECYHIAGEYDFMLKVLVTDTDGLEDFIVNYLKKTPGIIRTKTVITLGALKE
ncbi:transcriptional regulator [marine bacterium AO1-C]|nr:transcriptional regulator [marine bacterium AO1-C]